MLQVSAKKLALMLTVMLSLTVVGCGGEKIQDIPTSEIQKVVNTEELLKIQPVGVLEAKESYVFESVKDKIEEGFVIQAMINVKLQDVFVVKTKDPEAVKKAIEEYKTNSLRLFADGYGGEENAKAVEESKLEIKGDYVYFIATPNVDEIEEKILEKIVG